MTMTVMGCGNGSRKPWLVLLTRHSKGTAMARTRGTAYHTLASELRTSILQGKYADGSPLPTEAELASHHHLSRQTVRRASQELVAEDLVYRVAGRGTFAAPADRQYLRQFGSIEELMGLSLDTELELIEPSLGWRQLDEPTRDLRERAFAVAVESALERLGLGPLSR